MAHFYADENFPFPVVEALRELGHDVLTIVDDGKANQRYPDEAVLADATAGNRAVLTINRKHFRKLHTKIPNHAGLVLCSFDPNFIGQARHIDEAIEEHESLAGRIIRVTRPHK